MTVLANTNVRTPLHTTTHWASHLTFHHRRPASDICRLLVGKGPVDSLIDDVTVLVRKNAPTELVKYLQQQMYPAYDTLPVSKRFELATYFRSGGWMNTPQLIRMALGASLDAAVISYEDPSGHTLLHQIGRRWSTDIGRNSSVRTDDYDEATDVTEWRRMFDADNERFPWRVLLRDVVCAGSSVSATDKHGRTPLCTLIRESILIYSGRDFRNFRVLDRLLNIWLIELHKAGTDLITYGEQEIALKLRENINRRFRR